MNNILCTNGDETPTEGGQDSGCCSLVTNNDCRDPISGYGVGRFISEETDKKSDEVTFC